MEIEISVIDGDCLYADCPFCEKQGMIEDVDYVDRPMYWCNGGCVSILDLASYKIAKNICRETLDGETSDGETSSVSEQIPPIKLCKIVGVSLGMRNQSDEEGEEEEYSPPSLTSTYEEIKRGCDECQKIERWNWERTSEIVSGCSKHPSDDTYVKIDSYNVVCEETKDLDLRHDGCYIFLKYLELDGREFRMKYWGD